MKGWQRVNPNSEQIENLKHALMHLEANKIHVDGYTHSAWYCGNKAQFRERHIKAIEWIKGVIGGTQGGLTMEGKDKRTTNEQGYTMAHCHNCGQSFKRVDIGKGSPQLYCCRQCSAEAKRRRRAESIARRGKMKIAPWHDIYTDMGSGRTDN